MSAVRRRGRTWLYPDRARCLACRSYFGFIAVDGLFCSYRCAGIAEPSADPAEWPREHWTRDRGSEVRRPKRDWITRADADHAARSIGRGKVAYQCGYCLGWHIGTPDPAKEYAAPRVAYR